MPFLTGHIPDHPAVAAKRLGLHLHPEIGAMRAGSLPLRTNNRAKLARAAGGPGIPNQADTSSCEGQAHRGGITLRLALAGTPLAEPVSAAGLYYGAQIVSRVPNLDGTLPLLFDQGSMPSDILAAAALWGTVGESVWGQLPTSSSTLYSKPGAASDDPEYLALIEPAPEKLFAERAFRVKGAYFVLSSGLQKVKDILTALAAGRPITMALPASGTDFQSYSGGVLGWPSGEIDHANYIADYEWTGTQQQFDDFLVGAQGLDQYLIGHGCNSWGDIPASAGGWGEGDDVSGIPGGMYRFNRSFFDQLADPCVLDVVRA